MRAKTIAALQKTYDQSYLTCSTAVYYESQGNEFEALRCWRDCLTQLQSYNSYSHRARSDAEKALLRSLKSMKDQCEDRVQLLQALITSRKEAEAAVTEKPILARGKNSTSIGKWRNGPSRPEISSASSFQEPVPSGSLMPPSLPDRSNSTPAVRPSPPPRMPGSVRSLQLDPTPPHAVTPKASRTPSPDKRTGFLSTLRPPKKATKRSKDTDASPNRGPAAAAKAATLAWDSINRTQGGNLSAGLAGLPMSSSTDCLNTGLDQSSSDLMVRSLRRRSLSQSSHGTTEPAAELRPQPHRSRPKPSRPLSFVFSAEALKEPFDETVESNSPPPPPPHRVIPNQKIRPRSKAGSMDKSQQFDSNRRTVPCLPIPQAASPRPPAPPRPAKPQRLVKIKTSHDQELNSEPVSLGTSSPSSVTSSSARGAGKTSREWTQTEDDADTTSEDETEEESAEFEWNKRIEQAIRGIGKGVDAEAVKQVANEIVVKGDEVSWDDVAGLDTAKLALKEAVVYPFLRPDLFSGLREPARGMLLFGPPGTGKTMLARAVATESNSTFFSISASSLTSKYLGESEKLVRALFSLAKALAPSIIFVDEIDSLLSSRSGSGEHEATRRIKTEFLIQWSDLARAAAGKEPAVVGDPSRVLVLAATNLPWAIDEAARRRFVRRQYIPLPEDQTREKQIRNLLGHQKHDLSDGDMRHLVELTNGFSGSDITALAKDAAMGPLRSLGEALLHMRMDDIRPIRMEDFERSLKSIRPSVSQEGLKEFDDWAKQFGERVA